MATEQSQSVQIGSAEKDLSRPLRSHWSSIKRAPGQAQNSERMGPLRVLCVLCCVNEPCAGSERATEQPWGKQKVGTGWDLAGSVRTLICKRALRRLRVVNAAALEQEESRP